MPEESKILTEKDLDGMGAEKLIELYVGYFYVGSVVNTVTRQTTNAMLDRNERIEDLIESEQLGGDLQKILGNAREFRSLDGEEKQKRARAVVSSIASIALSALQGQDIKQPSPELEEMIMQRLYRVNDPEDVVRHIANNRSGNFSDKSDAGLYGLLRPVAQILDVETRNLELVQKRLSKPEYLEPLKRIIGAITGIEYNQRATNEVVLDDFRRYQQQQAGLQELERTTTYGRQRKPLVQVADVPGLNEAAANPTGSVIQG